MNATMRERMLSVYKGEVPDRIPFILDLSHYFYERRKKPWVLLNSYSEPERDLIDYNRKLGAGFYIPNQMRLFDVYYEGDVKSKAWIEDENGATETHWTYETPKGRIERIRTWSDRTYSWATTRYGIETEDDIRILSDAMRARRYKPLPDNYAAWDRYVGEGGIVQMPMGYSAMGYFMHYWMGMENTLLASFDWNDTLHEAIDAINANNIECLKMLMGYPGLVILMGDNFSSDCQPPAFFEEWSAAYYRQAADIIHESGKKMAVHVDGKLRGAIRMIGEAGADIIDAVTPRPMGDLTPQECREEAGEKLILSGGVSPDLWLPNVPIERFDQAVFDWLKLKDSSPALFANAGDQVPPGAEERRIDRMRMLVDEYGNY